MTNLTCPVNDAAARTRVTAAARLTWKDANGAVRFASVRARELSDGGAVVECDQQVGLPLYRLVHLQMEKSARDLTGIPASLRSGRVLAAVWQASPCRPDTGRPGSYALRFMTPASAAASRPVAAARRAS